MKATLEISCSCGNESVIPVTNDKFLPASLFSYFCASCGKAAKVTYFAGKSMNASEIKTEAVKSPDPSQECKDGIKWATKALHDSLEAIRKSNNDETVRKSLFVMYQRMANFINSSFFAVFGKNCNALDFGDKSVVAGRCLAAKFDSPGLLHMHDGRIIKIETTQEVRIMGEPDYFEPIKD
jgi:hypothetical protein